MINLTVDLIHLARYLLVPKGRLVFMLPTMSGGDDEVNIPPVEGMRELKVDGGSVQDFNGWGRRVCAAHRVYGEDSRLIVQCITMERTATETGPRPAFEDHKDKYDLGEGKAPSHHDFGHRVGLPHRDALKWLTCCTVLRANNRQRNPVSGWWGCEI